jgi:hypothetical protein
VKRSWFTSIAEIYIPVLVMCIILIMRGRIHIKPVLMAGDEFSIDEGSLIGQGTNLMPLIDPVEFIRSIASPNKEIKNKTKAFGEINNYFENFLN